MKNNLNKEKAIEEILEYKSSNRMMIEALIGLIPNKKNIFSSIFILTISIVFAFLIILSDSTVEVLIRTIEILNVVMGIILTSVFAGYGIFRGLMRPEFLKLLLEAKEGGRSYYKICNSQVVNRTLICTGIIFFNSTLLIFLNIIVGGLSIFNSIILGNIICIVPLALCLYIELSYIWCIKNSVFNMHNLFNFSDIEMMLKK